MTLHGENSKVKVLTDEETENLFRKFAVPLFRAADSPTRKEAAHSLSQMLWLALVTGKEIEEIVFGQLSEIGIDPDGIQAIRERYYNEMKIAITEEEVRALKARYKVRKR